MLALGRPALLALVGQTRIRHPEQVLPRVIETFKTVTDREQQYHLLNAFVTLIDDQEVLTMMETWLADDDLLIDTPFMRRLRENRAEGRIEAVRDDFLEILQKRFSPTAEQQQQMTAALQQIPDEDRLRTLLLEMVEASSFAEVQAMVAQQPHTGTA